MISLLSVLNVAIDAFVLLLAKLVTSKTARRLPPGPNPWPIIGNLFDLPSGGKDWETFGEWNQLYGTPYQNCAAPVVVTDVRIQAISCR
jgi:hypothetical protein